MSKLSDELISNISYTNKDFDSIYNELLDLTKKITNKWDPSQSNESDPGVVLLKLLAIIGDKCNYNIDKNVLECFPLSVTQEGNARNLYDSLGYSMKWYQSALATNQEIGFLCLNSEIFGDNENYIIPAFTPITDSTSSVTYTTLKETKLEDTNTIIYTPCIQGTCQIYNINGNPKISINNLDSENRLYFTDSQVAQNGIFIVNASNIPNVEDVQFDLNAWTRVDNLVSYPSNSKVYQFGVTADTNTCYVQFPDDISSLAKDGLYIRYTISDGLEGNIKANSLSNFVNDLGTFGNDNLVNDAISIIQTSAITNGTNPESLEDAYKNYKKTIGTFNTLVTRKDYENFINRLGEVANCVVSDRTNDINFTNYIEKWGPLYSTKELAITQDMTPFTLFLYLCKYISNVSSIENYNATFSPDNDAATLLSVEGQLDDVKAVQHDISVPKNASLIFNYNNKYNIEGTLILNNNVTTNEKRAIENNVKLALATSFNSNKLEYGIELDSQIVIQTILDADDRIKNVILTKWNYNTYERTFGNSQTLLNDINVDYLNKIVARMILAGNVQLYNYDNLFNLEFGQTSGEFYNNIKSITTEANITIPNSGTYSIQDNEIVELFADNYIAKEKFGAYTIINNTDTDNSIPANILYELQAPISIFYYDENEVQKKVDIAAGEIIKTNTTINAGEQTKQLSSNGYLDVMKINSSGITKNSDYLLVLNTTDEKLELGGVDNKFYILQENEYFILPNNLRTGLQILGKGTKLSVDENVTLKLNNTNIDLEEVTKDKIEEISWSQLEQNLILTETINYSFGSNVNISKSGDALLLANNETKTLGNDTFYYTAPNEITVNEIQSSNIQTYYIRSRLNINSTQKQPQQLLENQVFKITDVNGVSETINGDDENGPYIQFNNNVVVAGGENIDMKVLNPITNTFEYSLNGYIYNQTQSIERKNGVIKYTYEDGGTNNHTLSFNFSDSNYKYLIPISTNITSGSITFQGLYGASITIFNPYDSIPTPVSSIGTSLTEIIQVTGGSGFNVTLSGADTTIEIGEINKQNGLNTTEINYKDLNQDYKIEDQLTDILSQMKEIDSSNEFNWTYIVSADDKVLYPTAPSSFWNLNHICNAYTLPMINFDSTNIIVSPNNVY